MERLIQQVWECGVDAVIVQDIGVARIVMDVVEGRLTRGEEGKGLNGSCMEIHVRLGVLKESVIGGLVSFQLCPYLIH